MERACSTHEVDKKCIGKLGEKRLLGKPKLRREDNIKIDPK
jgi:hypothetical protein